MTTTNDLMISANTVLVFRALRNAKGWVTVKSLTDRTKLKTRTIRAMVTKFKGAGLLEEYKVWGGYRYKLAETKTKSAKDFEARLLDAEKLWRENAA